MIRTLTFGAVVLLAVLTLPCAGQTPGAPSLFAEETVLPELPDLSGKQVTGESVAALADFICGCMEDGGLVPDWAQVQTTGGQLKRISAADVFALLARTVYLWNTNGGVPAVVPIAPAGVDPPQLDPEDVPGAEFDPEAGRYVSTEQFLAQCADTVYWIDRLHTIPTAVGVDGVRLSATDYLAGLAICIQYSYQEGDLLDSLYLPRYFPPVTWIRNAGKKLVLAEQAEPVESAGSEAASEEQEPTESGAGYQGFTEETSEVEPWLPETSLALIPTPGAKVSGVVDVVAVCSGPVPGFVTFSVDGRKKKIMNSPPFGFRWDTSALTPGDHMLRVHVFGDGGEVVVDQVSVFTVLPAVKKQEKAPAHAESQP